LLAGLHRAPGALSAPDERQQSTAEHDEGRGNRCTVADIAELARASSQD
jgi:hypothetical protein